MFSDASGAIFTVRKSVYPPGKMHDDQNSPIDDNASGNPINNRAFIDEEYNRAFVATQYFGYLRRDSDIGGFLFWLDQVNGGPLRDVAKQHAMVCSFVTSDEYQQRFSSVVTHSNVECPH
jgi:hypothetical protein